MRLLRGESIGAVSREVQVPAHELEVWRRQFLDGGLQQLKRRGGDPEERALKQAQAKVGELAMKLELAEMLLEKRGYGDELTRLKASRGLRRALETGRAVETGRALETGQAAGGRTESAAATDFSALGFPNIPRDAALFMQTTAYEARGLAPHPLSVSIIRLKK